MDYRRSFGPARVELEVGEPMLHWRVLEIDLARVDEPMDEFINQYGVAPPPSGNQVSFRVRPEWENEQRGATGGGRSDLIGGLGYVPLHLISTSCVDGELAARQSVRSVCRMSDISIVQNVRVQRRNRSVGKGVLEC